jgi:succinate-semialdehyde dehydrogenase/glutarate-semialdehyde dehydrogenase
MVLVELELLRRQAFVDGAWADADSGDTFPVLNPATGDVWASGGIGGAW